MKFGQLKFSDGKYVYINSLFIARSYEGLLEGRPSNKVNASMEANNISRAKQVFSSEKIHVVSPLISNNADGDPSLPEVCLMADLLCFDPAVDPNAMMSSATVIWYQNKAFPIAGEAITTWAARTSWATIGTDGDW